MIRRTSMFVAFALAIGCTLSGFGAKAQAQSFTGKWIHQGSRGTSFLEFYPGDKKLLGPMRGTFRHEIMLDDGRVIQGNGYYTFRNVLPNRGWLTLHFSDGHTTTEHEHTSGGTGLSLRHHGLIRNYVRQ